MNSLIKLPSHILIRIAQYLEGEVWRLACTCQAINDLVGRDSVERCLYALPYRIDREPHRLAIMTHIHDSEIMGHQHPRFNATAHSYSVGLSYSRGCLYRERKGKHRFAALFLDSYVIAAKDLAKVSSVAMSDSVTVDAGGFIHYVYGTTCIRELRRTAPLLAIGSLWACVETRISRCFEVSKAAELTISYFRSGAPKQAQQLTITISHRPDEHHYRIVTMTQRELWQFHLTEGEINGILAYVKSSAPSHLLVLEPKLIAFLRSTYDATP